MKIKVKYFNEELEKINKIKKGDWIDLRCAVEEGVELQAGEFALIPLGVAIEVPEGYESLLAPRSSTFKTWGIIQTNSIGIIDESYKGDNDQWLMPVLATQKVRIDFNSRIAQFRIIESMPDIEIVEVESLENQNRGGLGSTGVK